VPYEFVLGIGKQVVSCTQGQYYKVSHYHCTITFPDGRKYVGEWKNGRRDGQGTYTYDDGDMFEGEWKDGEQWNGTHYDKDGKILWKMVNGELQ